MANTTFTFRVDDDLKASFAETARAEDRTAAQLLRVLMREAVRRRQEADAHDAWFRGEVAQAVREADDPNLHRVPDEEVRSNWRRQRAELVKSVGGKTA